MNAFGRPNDLSMRLFSPSVSSVFSSELCSRVVEKFMSNSLRVKKNAYQGDS